MVLGQICDVVAISSNAHIVCFEDYSYIAGNRSRDETNSFPLIHGFEKYVTKKGTGYVSREQKSLSQERNFPSHGFPSSGTKQGVHVT